MTIAHNCLEVGGCLREVRVLGLMLLPLFTLTAMKLGFLKRMPSARQPQSFLLKKSWLYALQANIGYSKVNAKSQNTTSNVPCRVDRERSNTIEILASTTTIITTISERVTLP